MRTSRSLLFCLFLTAVTIGLVETDVIEFQNKGVHAQTEEIAEILLRAILNQVNLPPKNTPSELDRGQDTLKNISSELESGQETLLLNDFMLLKNNIDGEVIAVRPDTKLMINEEDNVFQFKSHNPNENTIIVTAGSNLQLEYKLSKINILKILLAEDYLHPTRSKKTLNKNKSGEWELIEQQIPKLNKKIIGSACFGGLAGSLLGATADGQHNGDGSLMLAGCLMGMLATTVALNASVSDPAVLSDSWKEIHLAQWSVWSKE
ncbi:MAG: hypothetical protein QF847_00210 [Candidatus Marinimicrobia bacterium]|jgi:hypothetical protein|nr:hypothetical protein [Candidatus Neomarinimicrobiota bacterium]MDP6725655.1 hypothetical protein [Candidatus Neomarinimicrobiota bacterium]